MSGRAEGERKEGDDTWGRAVSGRRASRLAGQACQPREGTLAGRRGSRPARAERGGGHALGRATGLLAREWVGPRGGGPRGKAGSSRAREKEKELGWARLLGFGLGSLFLFYSISFLFSIPNSNKV